MRLRYSICSKVLLAAVAEMLANAALKMAKLQEPYRLRLRWVSPVAGNKSILAAKAPLWPQPSVTQTVTQRLHNNMYIHDDALSIMSSMVYIYYDSIILKLYMARFFCHVFATNF